MRLLSLSGLLVQSLRLSHLLVLFALCICIACEKVPLTSPTGSTITLSVDKTSVPIGGTATLTAVVSESSGTAPQNGTMVTFNGAFGTITPQEAPTVGGIARATFTGTQSGTAKVGAFSGPAKATEVELKVGGAAAERITLRSEPSTLPATGGTVTVIANVQDLAGGALPNTPVNFTTDNGSLSSNSVNTDSSGEARVQLTTNRTSKVTASVGAKTADFTITALPAPGVTVGSCSNNPLVGVPVNCTITPTVPQGGAPITNVTVNWGDGTGDQNLGPITGATVASHLYTRNDTFTVTATATDANGQRGTGSAAVNVNRSLPTVSITCPGTLTVGAPGTFTVTPPGNPAIPTQNVTVDFGDGSSRNLGQITGTTSFSKSYGAEGGYTAVATITDNAGQRGTSSCAVIVGRAAAPTITLSQTGTLNAGCGSFTVAVTPAAGTTISSVVVRQQDSNEAVYQGTTGSTFARCGLAVNNILVGTVTDSLGQSTSTTLLVR
jgi:adhesin/invasin